MNEEIVFHITLFASSEGDGLFHSSDLFPNNRKGYFADGFGLFASSSSSWTAFHFSLWFEVTRFMYFSLGILTLFN